MYWLQDKYIYPAISTFAFILQSVHLLYKYYNVKKVGKLVRFKQKGQKQASFLAFHKCCQVCLLRGPRYISTQYTYIVVKYKIHLYSLRNRPEKLADGSLFCLFLKLVQIHFIFTDNVRICIRPDRSRYFNPSKNYWFSFNAFLGPGWLNELGRWI
jgi:hypothetical protein